MRKLLLFLLVCLPAFGQLSGNIVRFTDGTNVITAGDNANNALRVNVVAGAAAGGTSSSFGAAFPATGTAAGWNDGTNMQGARVFDIDTGGGTIYVAGVNLRRSASGAATELIGQQTMTNSLPVTLASDESTINVTVATALPTGTNAIGRVGHDITGIGHGVTTVTTAGTDVALAGSTAAKIVTIQAQTDNTGFIAVGATGVDATIATGTGVLLGPGEAYTLNVDNLADVFIDSTVNGEGVRYTYQN